MNIIQSYWSKPAFQKNQDFSNKRKFVRIVKLQYSLYSLCFSSLSIKKHHKAFRLYTSDNGFRLFINQLNLPYDEVLLIINKLILGVNKQKLSLMKKEANTTLLLCA